MEFIVEKHIEKRKSKLEDNQKKNAIESLPNDTTIDILSRLPVSSLLHFRFVNRTLNRVSYDPTLIPLHSSRNHPCLILHCNDPIQNQIYFVELSGQQENWIARKFHIPFSNTMPDFRVVASCNGLSCLSDTSCSNRLYIYNPFTTRFMELPRSNQFGDQNLLLGFGYSRLKHEYKVVKVVYQKARSDVQVFSFTSSTWKSIGEVPYRLQRRKSGAAVNGRLHWLSKLRMTKGAPRRVEIISFDFGDEKFREVPGPRNGGLFSHSFRIAVLGGCLSAVSYFHFQKTDVWVMKEYGVRESWTKCYTIGDYSQQEPFLQTYGTWDDIISLGAPRVVCRLEDGEILMEYESGVLVSHDSSDGTCKKLVFQGIPSLFRAMFHIGSLGWIDDGHICNIAN